MRHAFVSVRSTGAYGRLTCQARKPKRENCTFYTNPSACIDAGFSPCKRCHPMHSLITDDPSVHDLLTQWDKDPTHRWSDDQTSDLGCDRSTIRRAFKRTFGTTFLTLRAPTTYRLDLLHLLVVDRVLLHSLRQDLKVQRPSPWLLQKWLASNSVHFPRLLCCRQIGFIPIWCVFKRRMGDRFGMR